MNNRVLFESVPPNNTDATILAIEHIFSQIPKTALPQNGMHVLLKPNLLAKHEPHHAVTTHPDVVRGVILALQKRGISDISLIDSPAGPHSEAGLRNIYHACGIQAVCEELHVTLCHNTQGHELFFENGLLVKRFTILQEVAQADYLINLPKLKTHVLTGMSGACKNLFGCIPGLMKAEFHMRFPERPHFGHMLLDLCEGLHANLHIMDGILGMEGDGPSGGIPRATGMLLASQNPHILDLAVCYFMGLSPLQVPTLLAAIERGLCESSLPTDSLYCSNGPVPKPFENFLLPRSFEGPMDFSQNVPFWLRDTVTCFAKLTAPHPVVRRSACIQCAKCADICPANAIDIQASAAIIRQKDCIRCFCCHEICPVQAVRIKKSPLFRL